MNADADNDTEQRVVAVLEESQRLGFLGERVISDVVTHARQFVGGLAGVEGRVADIGAGGGVPGLVIGLDRPDLELVLIDRRAKRTDFLRRVVRRLEWSDRIGVIESDVDAVNDVYDAVVARGFGPPEVTVRCATRLVRPGGRIVISEPPSGDRWDPTLLDELDLDRSPDAPAGVVVFHRRIG